MVGDDPVSRWLRSEHGALGGSWDAPHVRTRRLRRGLNMAPQACRAPDGDGRVRPANYRVRTDALNDDRCRVKLSFAECNYLKMPDEEKVKRWRTPRVIFAGLRTPTHAIR
jgi:hypothetical protein